MSVNLDVHGDIRRLENTAPVSISDCAVHGDIRRLEKSLYKSLTWT